MRGEYILEADRLEAAIAQAYEANLVGKNNVHGWPFDIYVHHGAGAYIAERRPRFSNLSKARRECPG